LIDFNYITRTSVAFDLSGFHSSVRLYPVLMSG
jgi:hypothetical protein